MTYPATPVPAPAAAPAPYTAYSVSWNLTRRCNLECAHCYLSAFAGADTRGELSTDECRRVIDEIAEVNPNVFLILTGGEPFLRRDLFEIADYAAEKRFTTVLGTNGVLLREREARLMRRHGVLGASISLDSTDPERHDAFRRLPGAWEGAVRATKVLNGEGLDFSLHMSVTDWNVAEVPAMIDLAKELGARVLNFFFLVRTGRGRNLTDIDPAAYERILTDLARAQGVGEGPPSFVRRMLGVAGAPAEARFEDPWSTPVGRADGLLIRAKCAPHFRRILWELNPSSPLLGNYAHGSCPAGKYYCRITPEGDVTPCPYMPVTAGSLRAGSFADLWRDAPVFGDLREPKLGGRCGACEFSKICGGCRCRAYATHGDYLAEDPACGYQPGAHGGRVVDLPATLTFGQAVAYELAWEPGSRERLQAIPSFARGMVVKGVEAYARQRGLTVITPALLAEVRAQWGGRFRATGP
ncbi:MAG TPA: radical SAM domain protein, coenzyme PQQ synthesis protein E [Candidatus Rokubacteria bacterium]|nr:radical SAM domain protein, coenzyme PQQ synthesis protein E [Candidatus Rokubacteria bacterium]